MKAFKTSLLALVILLPLVGAVYTKCAFGQSWQPVPYLPPNEQAKLIAVHPDKPALTFLVTRGSLYVSKNGGKDWKQMLKLGSNAIIHELVFHHNQIFLLTSEGLFESKNEGGRWKKIFGGIQGENSVRSLTFDPVEKHVLYLGTERGLFISRDRGRKWNKISNSFERQLIHQIRTDAQNKELFIATDKGLYRMMPARNRLDQVYVLRTAAELEISEGEETNISEENENLPSQKIRTFLITPASSLAMATENGLLISEDEGNYWERLPDTGLPKVPVVDLVHSNIQDTFFAATEKSVHAYIPNEKRWKEISEGLSAGKIERLTLATQNGMETLYAATQNGTYQITIDSNLIYPDQIQVFSPEKWNLLTTLFHYEPSISAIHEKAIRYANVHKNKTKRWQWTSRLKAFVPSLSIGKDFSTSDTVDIDRGSTNEPDQYILGPADNSRGWDFDLNWELSDLIWNTAQTSIDSREKLMVELREDILSEVTRLYYERRRAQIELVLRPLQDALDHANALLRIEELTAHLDVFTEGFMTEQMNSIYSQYPQFQILWMFHEPAQSETV